MGSDLQTAYGGKGANQALAIALQGIPTHMIGCIGNDTMGKNMVENLERFNVDTSYVAQKEGASGTAIIYLAEGDNQIVVSRGTNALVDSKDVFAALENANKNDLFVAQFEVPIPVVMTSIHHAKDKGLITVLNPSPYQSFDLDLLPMIEISLKEDAPVFAA